MNKITILLLTLVYNYTSFAQIDPAADLFLDLNPRWAHVAIDTGYHKENSDGMNHMTRPSFFSPLVKEQFAYYALNYIGDLNSGVFIEKLDLNSGQSVWTIHQDERNNDRKEYNFYLGFNPEGDLQSLNFRAVDSMPFGLWAKAKVAVRTFDPHTGTVLSYTTPPPFEDSLHPRTGFLFNEIKLYPYKQDGYLVNTAFGHKDNYCIAKKWYSNEGLYLKTDSILVPKKYQYTSISGMFPSLASFASYVSEFNSSPTRGDNYSGPFESLIEFYNKDFEPVLRLDVGHHTGAYDYLLPHAYDDYVLLEKMDSISLVPNDPPVLKYLKLDYSGKLLESYRLNRVSYVQGSPSHCRLAGNNGNLVVRCVDHRNISMTNPFVLEFSLLENNQPQKVLKIVKLKDQFGMLLSKMVQAENGDIILFGHFSKWKGGTTFDLNFGRYITLRFSLAELGLETSITETGADKEFIIEPNPAKDRVFINPEEHRYGVLRFLDVTGKQVLEKQIDENFNGWISVENLHPAWYGLQWIPKSGDKIQSTKILIVK
ncbi:MAG: hypothetical protein IPM48_06565 [Saprospiraceae bacterium]|nr:hypothetical protein [Saprospiraceae bacterium]